MKKTLVFMLGLILLITGNSGATALVQTTDYISFPVVALDSVTGVEAVPESVHVHVWYGSLTNTTVYSNREVCDGADCAQIDSVATGYAGAVPQQYYFHDQVQDIDGAGTAGVYTINVRLWRGTTPTSNWYSFQILSNSLNDAITAATVSLDDSLGDAKNKAILTNAEVANIDAWNPITDNDSLVIDHSSNALWLSAGGQAAVADAVWDEVITGAVHAGATSAGKYLRQLWQSIVTTVDQCGDAGGASTIDLAATASAVDNYYKGQSIVIVAGTGAGQCRTCTLYTGSTNLALIAPPWATAPDGDSWYGIINTGSVVALEVPAITGIKAKTDSLNFQGVAAGVALSTDAVRFSGSATAADNVELAFDGDTTWGTNPQFTVSQIFARPEAGNTHAMYLKGLGTGRGMYVEGPLYGLQVVGSLAAIHADGVTAGILAEGDNAIKANGDDVGIFAVGTNWYGIQAEGDSAGLRLVGAELNDMVLAGSGHISGWADSVKYVENVSERVDALQSYIGAGDGWRQHLMPFASANNDSIVTYDGGTKKSTIYLWKDASDATVLDSITMEKW